MCDYSLAGLRNRLAVDGEELVVHKFATQSMGLASPAELQTKTLDTPRCHQSLWNRIRNLLREAFGAADSTAVCIPPGACLVLKNIPLDLQQKWSVGEEENVVFMQTSAQVHTYRDAIRFSSGREVLLQHLNEGMLVKVVSMDGPFADLPDSRITIPSGRFSG